MVPSTLFAYVAVMLVAVNGAILPRQASFVSLTTQSTVSQSAGGSSAPAVSSGSASPSSAPASSAPAVSTQPTGSASAAASSAPAVSTGSASHSSAAASSAPAVSSGSASHSSAPASSAPASSAAHSSAPATTVVAASSAAASSAVHSSAPATTSVSAAHTSSAPATTTSTPSGSANCNGVQQWQASFAYTAGNKVIFNDQLFTAKQWTYDNAPPSHADQWTSGGACSQPINNQVSCSGVSAWQSMVAYTSGNKVTFGDHLWAAVQWTEANTPGDYSGTWQDLGVCA